MVHKMAGEFVAKRDMTIWSSSVVVYLLVYDCTVAMDNDWWIHRRKNTCPTGTWLEDAFQTSLRSPKVEEDPLSVKTFSEMLPYHCIPQW